jgi:diguanylate cyclase (GGDEF)-like protein
MPLRRLTMAANQIARGELSSRVRLKSGDEFQALANSFNFMAKRLQNHIKTLQAMSKIDRLILTGASFEEVSQDVIKHLLAMTEADSAAIVVRDPHSPTRAKMISSAGGQFRHERIPLPKELGVYWKKPRQVVLTESDKAVVPYSRRFLTWGHNYAAVVPVLLKKKLKGILLLGSTQQFDMRKTGIRRCADVASRLAVALSSVEREEALYRQAHFDELTGLPNRQLLKDRLEQLLVQVRREEKSGAMLFLDLDRFKEINDVFGHSVGDVVLTQAAERIVAEVRDTDTVARLGGDEFVVVMPKIENHGSVSAVAARLLQVLSESFSVGDKDHFLSASIGAVVFPDDGDSVETLLKNADSAMYRAKEAGRSRFEFFSKELNVESRRKINLERDLRDAYLSSELEVHYQPQFDLSTSVISGAEALLRWRHPKHGYVSPAEFVPLAEESDLIVDIGKWIIERAVHDLHAILELGLHPGPIAINVSARQLRDADFPQQVLEPLQRHNVHPGFLELEITETTVAQNRDTAVDILNVLRDASVKVAIDDFGTGYSSLSYLQHMPFDVIKIDKSFIDLIGTGDRGENICRTIIRMAHELGKEAIAEGVETSEQADFLLSNNCDFVQGYFYSKVLNRDDFVAFIEKQDFHTQRRKALEIV